jgi:hypothetical protein
MEIALTTWKLDPAESENPELAEQMEEPGRGLRMP